MKHAPPSLKRTTSNHLQRKEGNMQEIDELTAAQETRLRSLCQRYGVTFDAADYHPQFDLPTGYVAGWVGAIYVGVAPNGDASS